MSVSIDEAAPKRKRGKTRSTPPRKRASPRNRRKDAPEKTASLPVQRRTIPLPPLPQSTPTSRIIVLAAIRTRDGSRSFEDIEVEILRDLPKQRPAAKTPALSALEALRAVHASPYEVERRFCKDEATAMRLPSRVADRFRALNRKLRRPWERGAVGRRLDPLPPGLPPLVADRLRILEGKMAPTRSVAPQLDDLLL